MGMNTFWRVFCLIVGGVLLVGTPIVVLKVFDNKREKAEKFMYRLMTFVLVYKILHYAIIATMFRQDWVKAIPAEISALSYFLMPIAYLSGSKILKEPGRFIGFFAGFIEMVAIMISPGSFVNSTMSNFTFIESIVMHYTLYLGGLIWNFRIEPMRVRDLWKALLGFLIMLLWGTLAAFTWRFDHVNNKPENIMFIQECVLPDWLLIPGWDENHLFIIEYLAAFAVYIAVLYALIWRAFKYQRPAPRSRWGGGTVAKYLRDLKTMPMSNIYGIKQLREYGRKCDILYAAQHGMPLPDDGENADGSNVLRDTPIGDSDGGEGSPSRE